MLTGLSLFAVYFITAIAYLGLFVFVYARFTPYSEFKLIAEDNKAAAVSLGGAVLGFTFPVMASAFYTQSLMDMAIWAAITGSVQLVVFAIARKIGHVHEKIVAGKMAPAIALSFFSIAIGLLNAVCISH